MGISKVVFGNRTLIDLSNITVTPETLGEGVTAFNAKGELITGTMKAAPSTVSVRLNGAPGEVITYSGGALGDVTLNSAGTATVDIPVGNYTFSGGVSGYSKSASIQSNDIVNVHPDRIIYWYGLEKQTIGHVGVNGDATLDKQTNLIYGYSSGWSSKNATFTSTESAVDFTGYNTCKITTCPVQSSTETSLIVANRYVGVNSSFTASYTADLTIQQTFSSTGVMTYSFDISSMTSGYPGIRTNDYDGNYARVRAFNLYAIWLE